MKYSENSKKITKNPSNDNIFSVPDLPIFGLRTSFRTVAPTSKKQSPDFHSAYLSPKNHRQPQQLFSFLNENSPLKKEKKGRMEFNNQDVKLEDYFYGEPKTIKNRKINLKSERSVSKSIIQQSLSQIEEIQQRESINLKHQNQYLINIIRKMKVKEKKYIQIIQDLQYKNQSLQKEKDIYRYQCDQIKSYIFDGIDRMENIVVNNQNQFSFTLDSKEKSQVTMSQNMSEALEELNQKFEASMKSYKITNNPQFRKISAEIAKQIKQIKTQKVDSGDKRYLKQKFKCKTQESLNDYL